MPCSIASHEHNNTPWPAADAEITIHRCEKRCGYCPKTSKLKRNASELRRHVYAHHIAPADGEPTHATITIADFDGSQVERGREKAKENARKRRNSSASSGSAVMYRGCIARPKRASSVTPTPTLAKRPRTRSLSKAESDVDPSDTEHDESDAEHTDGDVSDAGVGESDGEVTKTAKKVKLTLKLGKGKKKKGKGILKQGPEDFELLPIEALRREIKMEDARVEEKQAMQRKEDARVEEKQAMQRKLRLEAELARREAQD